MIHRGTIVGLFQQEGGSGIGFLGIEDDRRGRVLIPCEGSGTCRLLDTVYPGTLQGGTFHNDAIVGERIYYELDSFGVLLAFAPVDRAPLGKIAEYEAQSAPPKKDHFINRGLLPLDDPIYSTGPILNGRKILKKKTPEESGTGRAIVGGFLPPGDPMYSRGPMIFGRPNPPKKKPSEDN